MKSTKQSLPTPTIECITATMSVLTGTPITELMQKAAKGVVSRAARETCARHSKFGRYPGPTWARASVHEKSHVVDEFTRLVEAMFGKMPQFNGVHISALEAMIFEGTHCLSWAQLGNNVSIQIIRASDHICVVAHHICKVYVTFAS